MIHELKFGILIIRMLHKLEQIRYIRGRLALLRFKNCAYGGSCKYSLGVYGER